MPKKSRKHSIKTAKTRKQRGGFLLQAQQGGSWFSGLTDKVKGLFSIDQQAQQQQQEPTQQQAQQAVARVTVPPSEPQPGWTNVPLNATPRKKKNNLNNWNVIGNNNLRPI